MNSQWNDKIWNCKEEDFEGLAIQAFRFQYDNNPIYQQYVTALGVKPASVQAVSQIPFLPIRFFKSHTISTTYFDPVAIFESSGTTGMIPSRHFIKDLKIYYESFTRSFNQFYGSPGQWCIVGLLPSYLERANSSLVVMVDHLIKLTKNPDSGFYLNELPELAALLKKNESAGIKTLLIGVTFALLDFAEMYSMPLKHTVIMETGGMKGRRKEMIRTEVHDVLCNTFHINSVHSEYGMTELLSQAYSKQNGLFECPSWMKVFVRDEEDPLSLYSTGKGALNIIDLANIYSCSFIAIEDAGKVYPNGQFEVLGRIDNTDIRGCSLLAL